MKRGGSPWLADNPNVINEKCVQKVSTVQMQNVKAQKQ